MAYLAFALMFIGGLVVSTYLIVQGHPWWAALVLLLVSSLEWTKETKE